MSMKIRLFLFLAHVENRKSPRLLLVAFLTPCYIKAPDIRWQLDGYLLGQLHARSAPESLGQDGD